MVRMGRSERDVIVAMGHEVTLLAALPSRSRECRRPSRHDAALQHAVAGGQDAAVEAVLVEPLTATGSE